MKLKYVVLFGLMLCCNWLEGVEELRPSLAKLAATVKEVMNKEGFESVAVGSFTGPATEAVPTGPGLKRILMQELDKLGIKVARAGAPMGINAEFSTDVQTGSVKTILKLALSNGDPVKDIHTVIKPDEYKIGGLVEQGKTKDSIQINSYVDGGSLAELLGKNFDNNNLKEKSFIDTVDVIKAPSAALVATDHSVRTSQNSPFSVKVNINGQTAPVQLENGIPFITLHKGDTFTLVITNHADFDAAATVLIDGINSFAVSEMKDAQGNPKYTRWIIAKGTSLELKGWHKTNEQVTKFVLTDLGESVAGQLGQVSDVGGISVKFQATWKLSEPRPVSEPVLHATALPEDINKGIGEGDIDQQVVVEDKHKREYGIVRSIVVLRYMKPEPKPAE